MPLFAPPPAHATPGGVPAGGAAPGGKECRAVHEYRDGATGGLARLRWAGQQAGSAIPPCRNPANIRAGVAGFTLLELLAVIGVIAILTGIVIGVGQRASESGRVARARSELAVLSAVLDAYRAEQGDYPRTADPARLLQSLIGRRDPAGAARTNRPLLDPGRFSLSGDPYAIETAVLLDPWDQPYRYAYKVVSGWTNPTYVLASAGPDQTGTTTLLVGGFPDVAAPGNADNLYAIQP